LNKKNLEKLVEFTLEKKKKIFKNSLFLCPKNREISPEKKKKHWCEL
jgi:hypothetical protein